MRFKSQAKMSASKNQESEIKKGAVAIYKSKSGPYLDVRLEKETVWLTQKQMANLFCKDNATISEHIKNIYKEGELKEKPTVRHFQTVQKEGARKVERKIAFYNLDVIISVGYRVKSVAGTQFRIWAAKILKSHLLEGYTINQNRLLQAENNFIKMQEAICLLRKKSGDKFLSGQSKGILDLLADYSKTIILLDRCGKRRVYSAKNMKECFILDYWKAREIIAEIKREIIIKKEADESFGQEKEESFKKIIERIYKKNTGREEYPSLEEKAARLLYFIIKEKPFLDGNKRIGSFLFVYFLDRNKKLYSKSNKKKISSEALAVLILLIFASKPKEKEDIIEIIINLLAI